MQRTDNIWQNGRSKTCRLHNLHSHSLLVFFCKQLVSSRSLKCTTLSLRRLSPSSTSSLFSITAPFPSHPFSSSHVATISSVPTSHIFNKWKGQSPWVLYHPCKIWCQYLWSSSFLPFSAFLMLGIFNKTLKHFRDFNLSCRPLTPSK